MVKKRIAALVFDIVTADRAVRILPAGQFRSADGSGRPHEVAAWYIDADIAAQVIARANARVDLKVIDYEHQTLKTEANGQPAPAAGWMVSFEWRDDGLYMVPEWTERAAFMVNAKPPEYRYISPVFTYDAQGRVLEILHAGLTNFAGLDGLTDLAALSAHFQLDEETSMNELLKQLLAAIGLADTTTEADAISAVVSLKAKADSADGQIAALKAAAPDPAKYVPIAAVTDLQGQVATLTAEKVDREVNDLVATGMKDGRILPAMESWARDLGKKDVAALNGYLESAKPMAALAGSQTGGKKPDGAKGAADLDATQLAVCKGLGVKPEDFKATLDEQAAA